MIEPIIIDDLIPTRFQLDLANELMCKTPYYFQPGTTLTQQGAEYSNIIKDQYTIDSPQFVHPALFNNVPSDKFNIIRPMLYFLEDKINRKIAEVRRIKVNCLLRNDTMFTSNNYNIPHTDEETPRTMSMVYYVNDSDGDTFFFNEHWGQTQNGLSLYSRSSPKMGRAVIFDSIRFHAGSNPIKSDNRFVINITFKLENEKQPLAYLG